MTLPSEAVVRWLAACPVVPRPAEHVELRDAVGRVCAADVRSLVDSPPGEVAAMDGIAVTAAATTGLRLAAEAYDVVDTGDPLPVGRDAVVVREQVTRDGTVAVLAHAAVAGRHVRPRGEDVATGDLLLRAGSVLRPVDVALAAAGGHLHLPVTSRPHVVVVPTGDEVRPLGRPAAPGEVLDTNSLMLVAQAVEAGATAEALPVVPDDPAALAAAVRAACATADLVVVGAGSSAGRDDHTAEVVRSLGTVVVHGLAVRPGHPALVGVVDGTPVLGSPGYPVSAWLAFELLAVPLLAGLLGTAPRARPTTTARLATDVGSALDVDDWVRVAVRDGVATPLPGGAGALSSLATADGLLRVPAGTAACAAGDPVEVVLLRPT
ncbi:MAG: Molybdopterin molybdochelatase [Frankiales bacterium]|nr:Molybdopterin molybdochelatase [Frankiales bacterium]